VEGVDQILYSPSPSPLVKDSSNPEGAESTGNSNPHGFIGTEGASPAEAHPAENFVRSALLGIFVVDAGFLLSNDLVQQATAEYGLMILAWLWSRRWLQSLP